MPPAISPLTFFEIVDTVKAELEITDAYVENASVTIVISPDVHFTQKIEKIQSELMPRGFDTTLQRSNGEIKLLVFHQKTEQLRSSHLFRANYPLILFVITIVSVAIAGYYTALGHLEVLRILERV
ncbi:MAG: hypothetical protein JSV76_04035, partial [Candidatus Bathyarchaeota archaeon]